MLSPWLGDPDCLRLLRRFSDAAGRDLARLGTDAGDDEVRDTANAQPLLAAASLLSVIQLFGSLDDARAAVDVVAGHSVGEFAAAAIAGVLGPEEAVALTAERGRLMACDAAKAKTGMSAVVGADLGALQSRLGALGLTAANLNGAGQVVAAGRLDKLAELAADPPGRARVVPLEVAGAFHTSYMSDAAASLASRLPSADGRPAAPLIPLLTNATGKQVASSAQALVLLAKQVTSPVRWDLVQETLAAMGATEIVEAAPGGVLRRLARRAIPGASAVALTTPQDLEPARALVAQAGGAR